MLRQMLQRLRRSDPEPSKQRTRRTNPATESSPAAERFYPGTTSFEQSSPTGPDRFSADPWERRVAEQAHKLTEKNDRILELESTLEQRESRLRAALKRVDEANRVLKNRSSISLDQSGVPLGPDTLAKLAAEKGVLESKQSKLQATNAQLRIAAESHGRDRQTAKAYVDRARQQLRQRDQLIHELRTKIAATETDAARLISERQKEIDQIVQEISKNEDANRSAETEQKRLEETLRAAGRQTDLYRKNLVQAEGSLAERDSEVAGLNDARRKLKTELREAREIAERFETEGKTVADGLTESRNAHRTEQARSAKLLKHIQELEQASETSGESTRRSTKKLESQLDGREALLQVKTDEASSLVKSLEELNEQLREERLTRDLVEEARMADRLRHNRLVVVSEERALDPTGEERKRQAKQTATGAVNSLLRWFRR